VRTGNQHRRRVIAAVVTTAAVRSVFVPVTVVEGVAVAVVQVVDVVTVPDRLVAAAWPVLVIGVVGVLGVGAFTLVPVTVVVVVHVSVVEVVDVVAVDDRRVAAAGRMLVLMILVDRVGGAHVCASSACRIASRTMWITWSSVIT